MRKRINLYLILILLIVFCVFQYGIQKICGFTIYPDEFGYWASAARAVGYDWSEVASMGSYYSFGYSMILIPVLKLFTDGVAAYRAALFVHMLMMCGSVFLFQGIITKVFPEMEAGRRALISGAAVLYPPWIFYMQMTMAEAVLFFVFLLDVYLFLCFMEQQQAVIGIGLAVSLVYGYSVHMRTVGVVIACVITLLCWRMMGTGHQKNLFVLFGVMVLLGVIVVLMKDRIIVTVFSQAGEETIAVNDYSGQWSKIPGIFTLSGMLQLWEGIIGKLYYLGISSFGTFYWGLGWCFKESSCLIRNRMKKENMQPKQWMAMFLFLAVIGQVLISSIYKYRSDLIDALVFGRYNEFLTPVMMLIGIVVMTKSRFLFPATAAIGTVLGGVTFLLLKIIDRRSMSTMRTDHIPGFSYFLQRDSADVVLFFRNTYLLSLGLILLICVFVWLSRWRTSLWWILTVLLFVEIAAGLEINSQYTYRVNDGNFINLSIAEVLQGEIYYLDEGRPPYVAFLQMQVPAEPIHVMEIDELTTMDITQCMVVTCIDTEQDEFLRQFFDKKITAVSFCLYYN